MEVPSFSAPEKDKISIQIPSIYFLGYSVLVPIRNQTSSVRSAEALVAKLVIPVVAASLSSVDVSLRVMSVFSRD